MKSEDCEYLALGKLRSSSVVNQPFPHIIIDNMISQQKMHEVNSDFPAITQRGSFPISQFNLQGGFAAMIRELQGETFRNIIAEKFNLNLRGRPTMITLRGYSNERDGLIHTDSKSKLVTVLIYFNETWNHSTGKLRILRSNQMDDYHAEISPTIGSCLIFKVTDNCWHGYPAYIGVRRAIQLNYIVSEQSATVQQFKHRLSAMFKAMKKKLKG